MGCIEGFGKCQEQAKGLHQPGELNIHALCSLGLFTEVWASSQPQSWAGGMCRRVEDGCCRDRALSFVTVAAALLAVFGLWTVLSCTSHALMCRLRNEYTV
jgi:hypothetical protein